MKKKILILGGNSDIGIQLCQLISDHKKFQLDIHYNSNLSNLEKIKLKGNTIKANFETININNLSKKFRKNYDIIINLVGFIDNISFKNFNIKEFQKTLKINTLIPWLIIRNSLNHMKKKRWGRIINSSSIGVNFGGGVNTFTYSASKHLNEFIPQEIKKLYKENILYNVIKIGLTNTKIHKKINKKDMKKRIQLVPLKKIADPKEIANYIYFLISNDNQFITDEILTISGGE